MIFENTKTVLINLKTRTDRLEQFKANQRLIGWPLPEPEIFEAIRGDTVGVPSWFVSGGGAYGCRQSHLSILERAIMDGVPSLLIFEDDLVWRNTISDQLTTFLERVPQDHEILFLGGQHISAAQIVADGVVRCRNTQRTHAIYYRNVSTMKKVYGLWASCNRHIDHELGPWSGKNMAAYAPDPFIFGQGEFKSDISGNNDRSRYWSRPTSETKLVYFDPSTPRKTVEALQALGVHCGNWKDGRGYDQGLNKVKGSKPALKKVLDTLAWEVASDQGKVVGVWHPDISLDLVRSVWTAPIVEVSGNLKDILPLLPELTT